MTTDLNFIADIVGEITTAYVLVKVIPYLAGTVLVMTGRLSPEKIEGLFRRKDKFM